MKSKIHEPNNLLSELNDQGGYFIAQNVDGLHHIAGSRDVIELHGNIFATKCTTCDFRGNIGDEFSDLLPSCKICGSYLRPDVV